MNFITILVISSEMDFTTDYVCYELEKKKAKYLRLNIDCFADYKIVLNVNNLSLSIELGNSLYIIKENILKSVYFRAPVFSRNFPDRLISIEEQLYKSQWLSFIRNLIIFENVKWINNPVDTYKAENKLLQLKYANQIGFKIPQTFVVNTPPSSSDMDFTKDYAIKSIDIACLKKDDFKLFAYTSIISGDKLKNADLTLAPIIIQEKIDPKIDLRVTIIEDKLYAVSILKNGNGIDGDWRKESNGLEFNNIELPIEIKDKCTSLNRMLNLTFSAMDLAICNNEYYFIEVNPTGEWAWLVKNANQNIPVDIADSLLNL